MEAYIIDTYREVHDFLGIDIFETFSVDEGNVTALYVPKKILFGVWDLRNRREFILSTEPPYLGAQRIVDGERKGLVTKIELDDDKKMKIVGILERLYELSEGQFKPRAIPYKDVLWCDTYRILKELSLQELAQQTL